MSFLTKLLDRFCGTEAEQDIRARQLACAERDLAMAEYYRDLYQVQVEGQARLVLRLKRQLSPAGANFAGLQHPSTLAFTDGNSEYRTDRV